MSSGIPIELSPFRWAQGTDPFMRGRLVERLREVLGGTPPRLEIEVSAADTTRAARGGPTHTVVLRIDGAEALGLRIRHGGNGPGVAIIGFWTPAPTP